MLGKKHQRFFIMMLGLAFTCLTAFLTTTDAKVPAPQGDPIKISQCYQMTPVEMAKTSPMVQKSFQFLLEAANQISDVKLRKLTLDCLNNPAPTILEMYPTDSKMEEVKQKLVAAGYIKPETTYKQFLPPCADPLKAPQPFFSAPGSGYMSHHSYPGGLATHAAVNTKVSIALFNAYVDAYGYSMDKDVVIAAEVLHDLAKPWVFQWQNDGSSLPEASIAGAGAHHVLGLAEAIHRGLPSDVIVAMACAHTPPDNDADEKQVVDWIKAACILAGKDPVQLGLLASNGLTVPLPRHQETFITHLGDHDYVLTVPAAQWMIGELAAVAKKEYGMSDEDLKGYKFNAFRNFIFSRVSAESLHQVFIEQGHEGVVKMVQMIVTQ